MRDEGNSRRSAEWLFAQPDVTIKFAKLYEGAIIPSKRPEDAGYDVYGCWKDETIQIYPHQTVMLPTCIASAFPAGYAIILKERGSTGTIGIGQRSGVIDSGYRGEWMIPVTNLNDQSLLITKKTDSEEIYDLQKSGYIVYPYHKAICQAIVLKLPESSVEEISYEELQSIPSTRGVGKLGSSGK